MKKILLILLILMFGFVVGCGKQEVPQEENNQQQQDDNSDKDSNQDDKKDEPKLFREEYTPELFSLVSYESKEVVDGLILYQYKIEKKNGDIVIINELEVDLNKVNIEAGTKNNMSYNFNYAKTTPYSAGTAYTSDTSKKVYATLNADFFGSQCVNAFVKDGFIVKASHNDNGGYDYLQDSADVPASAPMLFGVKGNVAQIAPIQNYDGDITLASVKKNVIRAKLSYVISAGIKSMETSDTFKLVNQKLYLNQNDIYAILDLSKGSQNVEILDIKVADKKLELEALGEGKTYLYCNGSNTEALSFLNSLGVGKKISLSIKSPDGLWDEYETILGCRHALVINDKIADTVKLEYSNGATNGDVPRSSVGINQEGKVCIYAIESLYYGKKANDGDTHGCNLELLAEFMYYNNIKDGANFDGGGSTQLICKIDGTDTVVVRSSDSGSTDLTNTRSVMNVIMVTEK